MDDVTPAAEAPGGDQTVACIWVFPREGSLGSSPVPTGLQMVLTVPNGSRSLVRYANTVDGAVSTPLPKAWKGERVRLSLSGPARTGYLVATMPPVRIRVA